MSHSLCGSIRVLVAESSPISSQLLAEAVAKFPGIEALGFTAIASEVLRLVHSSTPDVLLVSARMEEESHRGITLLKDLRADHRALRAVVLLDSSKPQEVVEAFRAGACGVFCRNTEIEVLCKCIAAVHGGQIWASSQELAFVLGALAVQRPPQFDSQCLPSLSTREKEVVRCLVEGFTNNQIAETLAISQHTVKNYLFKIFDKMGVANRVELVYRVLNAPAVLAASLRPDRVANLYLPAAVNVLLPNPIEPQLKKPAQPVPPFVESGPATVTARALSKAVG